MIKKILLGMTLLMSMVSCTEDYTDWANPQTNPQEDAVAFGNGSVTPVDVINLADVTEDKVQVASIVAPTSSNAAYAPTIKINLGDKTFDIDNDGKMATADLATYISEKYGKRPVERDIEATLDAWISNGSTVVKMATSETFQVKAIPVAPVIDEGYYLVGDMFTTIEGETEISGWTKESAKAFKHSDKDVYDDPIFTLTFETKKANQYWKIIPKKNIVAGDLWADGVVGPKVDGSDSMEGLLTNVGPGAGKIAEPGKYKLTLNMMDYSYTIEPVNYDPFIYFIGSTDAWGSSDQKLALVDDEKGTYTGYIYLADPNNAGFEFKFQRVAGNWDNAIGASNFVTFKDAAIDANNGNNLGVNAGEGVYYMDVNLSEGTITATKVESMGMVGGFQDPVWQEKTPHEMTWNAEEYCFEATNVGVTADGWKFIVNKDWAINLGGSIDNLEQDGANLTVAGNTIKLYPTRKTKDNIFCTVE